MTPSSIFPGLRWRQRAEPRPSVPEGVVTWAIGDIHGHADLLETMLARIRSDAGSHAQTVVAPLGDYVDRGPDSRGVVDLLLQAEADPGVTLRPIKGNHDEVLLQFLADHSTGPRWSEFGGRETLFSYGVEPPGTRRDLDAWREAQEAFAAALPSTHRDFFGRLELSWACGDYLFVHAGVRPGIPLDQQDEHDLMWIRGPFLEDAAPLEKVIVHGHTPAAEPFADHRRIGLDTGAYATGVLTACRFEGEERRLVQVRRTPGGTELSTRPF
jgi:serine/threonine protein phosphatase 1